jgi:hypothetical protein
VAFIYLFILVVLGFELRALSLLGKDYHLRHTSSPFFIIIFQIVSHARFPGLALDHNPLTYASLLNGVIGMNNHA